MSKLTLEKIDAALEYYIDPTTIFCIKQFGSYGVARTSLLSKAAVKIFVEKIRYTPHEDVIRQALLNLNTTGLLLGE